MPKVNFPQHNEAGDFSPVPEGDYEVEVSNIESKSTSSGDEMWKMRLKIVKGDCSGRNIFDNMVFSAAAMGRVKLICSRMGIDVSKEQDLTEAMLIGKKVIVSTVIEEYEDSEGMKKRRNKVPFAGYKRVDTTVIAPASGHPEEPPKRPTRSHLDDLSVEIKRMGIDLGNLQNVATIREFSKVVVGKETSREFSPEDVKRFIAISSGLHNPQMIEEYIAWAKKQKAQTDKHDAPVEEKAPF